MVEQQPLLIIRCITYNHEPYIRQCLEGFVMQQTTFPFYAVVHDDASTDKTAEIIREYAEKYPSIIKPIFETENQWRKKNGSLRRIMNQACKGAKYIAMCEGDDYWTDPYKLQKQVDFLEAHDDVSVCCHAYKIHNTMDNTWSDIQLSNSTEEGFYFTKQEHLNRWICKTLTCVYRQDKAYSDKQYKYNRDVHLTYNLLSHGKGYCFNFMGGVYHKHPSGIFGGLDTWDQDRINYLIYSELVQKNSDDKVLVSFFNTCHHSMFLTLCSRIKQHQHKDKEILQTYLKNDLLQGIHHNIGYDIYQFARKWLKGSSINSTFNSKK